LRYLITGEYVDPGPLLTPEQFIPLVEGLVIPSFEILARLESEGKVLGGGLNVGGRAGSFILDAASNDEANQILQSLPFWGLVSWTVTPLSSFQDRARMERQMIDQVKQTMPR
jgi:hypothetical protein